MQLVLKNIRQVKCCE